MIYVSTHAGKRHSVSEDAVLVGHEVLSDVSEVCTMPESGFVCIADGVGGNGGGDRASQFVLSELPKWDENAEDLKAYLEKTNDLLITNAAEDKDAPEMATTLTGFYIQNGRCRMVHVGNTRAYIKQGKYLKQLSADHTTYNWLMSSGQIEAAEHSNRSEVTNCFGGNNRNLLSKLYISECQRFTIALLTSDGIHDYVDLDSLEEILNGEGSYAGKCEEITQRAKDAGSEDDLSIVIICPVEN